MPKIDFGNVDFQLKKCANREVKLSAAVGLNSHRAAAVQPTIEPSRRTAPRCSASLARVYYSSACSYAAVHS